MFDQVPVCSYAGIPISFAVSQTSFSLGLPTSPFLRMSVMFRGRRLALHCVQTGGVSQEFDYPRVSIELLIARPQKFGRGCMAADPELKHRVAQEISRQSTFKEERRKISWFLFQELSELPDGRQADELANLRSWASNLLRQRNDETRFKSLVVFSFLIEVETNQENLAHLTSDLEKLLPSESIQNLYGVAYLFIRLSQMLNRERVQCQRRRRFADSEDDGGLIWLVQRFETD
jgi:hypothetical protein